MPVSEANRIAESNTADAVCIDAVYLCEPMQFESTPSALMQFALMRSTALANRCGSPLRAHRHPTSSFLQQ
uniref:Uncharacterized protein n=1 Tax=Candidatus Kentrum sp. TUN TaxID=2126343 RepID=A0A450ZT19_9GAMM|nr:MAG: hypothetical protein BECKTUN1418F_GA0071002_10995 [Candidatus Kentron sp. TUN]VFK64661.1 MAG: hypothetical protein BECKTUN1418E_GA0071001_10975 [Candidatus Kentron sp. TUN]